MLQVSQQLLIKFMVWRTQGFAIQRIDGHLALAMECSRQPSILVSLARSFCVASELTSKDYCVLRGGGAAFMCCDCGF
jgi:hypothetical protein